MNKDFNKLYQEVPHLLNNITENSKPIWGKMGVIEMIQHLATGFELSMSYKEYDVITPAEKIPSFQRWLMTDKPFAQGAPIPKNYVDFEIPKTLDLDSAKKRFVEKLRLLKETIANDESFWSVHQSFGKMDAEHTLQLHYKHIRHHFQQFGALPING